MADEQPLIDEPLRSFLISELAKRPVELDEGEVISDAIVIYRVTTVLSEENDEVPDDFTFGEYYKYTTTRGVNLAMAFGMLELTAATLDNYYKSWMAQEDDEDE